MAVPEGPTDKRYTGNGVTKIFTIPFLLLAATDLDVYIDGIEISSGFAITNVGNPTSTITFTVAPVDQADIYLQLNVPFERLNDYQENGDFLSSTVNRDFDRIWQALKQLFRWSTRSLRLGNFDEDGAGWYRAKGNGIRDLKDPVELQDAATKNWAQQYIGKIVGEGQGPINVAANVQYQGPDGAAYNLQQLSGLIGSDLVGHRDWDNHLTTVGRQLRLLSNNTIYSDDARFGGNIQAAADAMGDNTVLVIRGETHRSTHLLVKNKVGPVVVCAPGGKLNGQKPFTFATAYRGVLVFDGCSNPSSYRVKGKGTASPKNPTPIAFEDGDSLIEYINCSGVCNTIECESDKTMAWGIIHVNCDITNTIGNTVTRCTQQSGIGHAGVNGGVSTRNTIRYSGLYGIECEGTNKNVKIFDNDIDYCLSGVSLISNLSSCSAYHNRISNCVYGAQANSNGGTQSGNSFLANDIYDCLFSLYMANTNFTTLKGNKGLIRVANGYAPRRAQDYICGVVNDTTVLIPNAAAALLNIGDVHRYITGPNTVADMAVQSFSTVTYPNYGSVARVVYTSSLAGLDVGDFFMRYVDFTDTQTTFLYVDGTYCNNLEVYENSGNGPYAQAVRLAGNMNGLSYSGNKFTGEKVLFRADDSIPITNSRIVLSAGDVSAPSSAMFAGSALAKIAPSVIGRARSMNMSAPNKPVAFFASTATSTMVRLRVSLVNTTKTASTGNVGITVNGVNVGTIAVGELGVALVTRDLVVLIAASSFVINVADTFGDMGFASATVESWTVE